MALMKLLRLDVTYKLTKKQGFSKPSIENPDNYNTFGSVFSNG